MLLRVYILFLFLFGIFSGCAHSSKKPEPSEQPVSDLNKEIEKLKARIDSLETKRVNTQVNSTLEEPTLHHGKPVEMPEAKEDPEAGFIKDTAIQNYRTALILFHSKKFPEASLVFASFIEKYPDHIFSGNAQFYIGECYFKQNEYKLALQEYSKVIKSYEQSPSLPDTLQQMAVTSDHLQNSEDAIKYRHLLSTLFPASPQHEDQALPLDTPPPTVPETQ